MTVIAVVVDVVAVVAVSVNYVVGAIVLVVVVVVAVVGDRRGDGEWRSHCYPEVEVYERKKKKYLKAFFLGRDFVLFSFFFLVEILFSHFFLGRTRVLFLFFLKIFLF